MQFLPSSWKKKIFIQDMRNTNAYWIIMCTIVKSKIDSLWISDFNPLIILHTLNRLLERTHLCWKNLSSLIITLIFNGDPLNDVTGEDWKNSDPPRIHRKDKRCQLVLFRMIKKHFGVKHLKNKVKSFSHMIIIMWLVISIPIIISWILMCDNERRWTTECRILPVIEDSCILRYLR